MNLFRRINQMPSSSQEHPSSLGHHIILGLLTIVIICIVIVAKLSIPRIANDSGNAIASVTGFNDTIFDSPRELLHDPSATSSAKEETIVEKPLLHEISGQLQRGESLDVSLKRMEVPENARQDIVSSLKSCMDLRKLMPKDRITVLLNEKNELFSCTYEASPFEIYQVSRSQDSFTAIRQSVEVEYRLEKIEGEVENSLVQAFTEIGETPFLVYSFADIFASRIDFNTESRSGDRFVAIVEKYYTGKKFIGYGKILYASYQQVEQQGVLKGYNFEKPDGESSYFDEEGKELGTSFLRSPVPVGRVTSRFTFRRKHPISGIIRPHLGVDLAAPIGTPIMAAADGKVVFAGRRGGFGKQIILQHGNGYRTHYGHLSRFAKNIKKGQNVKQKEIIGYVGSTGVSTGPHLDYRLQENGVFKNPFAMKFKPRSILKGENLARLKDMTNLYDSYLVSLQAKSHIIMAKKVTFEKEPPVVRM